MGALKLKQHYTYTDYLSWPSSERWEIINGEAYNMSPAPHTRHQIVSSNLSNELYTWFKNKKCRVFSAPFDVRLKNEDENEILTVVQPDISIFCDNSKLDDKGALGAPDFVAEILSEPTYFKDINIKLLLYQYKGVNEYWIIDPDKNTLLQYKLDNLNRYFLVNEYSLPDEMVYSTNFEGLAIKLSDIFR